MPTLSVVMINPIEHKDSQAKCEVIAITMGKGNFKCKQFSLLGYFLLLLWLDIKQHKNHGCFKTPFLQHKEDIFFNKTPRTF